MIEERSLEMEFLFTILKLVIVVAIIVYYFLKKTFQYWKVRNIPYIQPSIPYGNTKGLGTEYHTYLFMKNAYNELKSQGPFGGCYISFRPAALINDLNLVKEVLVGNFKDFKNRGSYYNPKDDPISAHISNLENDQWKYIRSKLTPAFSIGKLKLMHDTISTIGDSLVATISNETAERGSLNIKEMMARFTTDVIGDIAFGLNCESVKNKSSKFFEMSIKSMESFHFGKRLILNHYKNIARMLGITLTPKYVSEFYTSVVKDTIDHRNKTQINQNDLINILIKMMDNEGLPLDQVTAQSFFYFVSGYETSSTTLVFCLYELSTNKDLQQKARDSVRQVMATHEDKITIEAVNDMGYLDQVIKETLRIWPPSPSIQRIASNDFKVPGTKHFIEKDCVVMVPIYAIHHDPEIYPDPEVFDPERFTPEEISKRHPCAWLPFGDGPRVCPAIKFAMLEIKICLAKLLMNYNFALDTDKTRLPLRINPSNFMMNPDGGVFVNFDKI